MPAYVTHTLFSHLALQALLEARHPLGEVALHHAALFRVAGIAGCDIQCMPYQVCSNCKAPYRHDQNPSGLRLPSGLSLGVEDRVGDKRRSCLACRKEALEDFKFKVSDGRILTRRDVERDLYGNTHLVLYRSFRGYGVRPKTPAGPAEQPLPRQVIDHLAFTLMDAEKIAGAADKVTNYIAFTLGWFSHVVSDAIFKGVYPHAAKVNFFGSQYSMDMLPAAETLSMTDIAHDWGVHWPTWHEQLLADESDGGALRHLAMGDAAEAYGPQWTPQHGKPDPAIGRVIDAVRPLNRRWFHQMYVQPDYSSATPRLDKRPIDTRAMHRFIDKRGNEMDLGRLRRYAIGTGWYDAFIRGVEIYVNAVTEAAKRARMDAARPEWRQYQVGWDLWTRVIAQAIADRERHDPGWGSRLDIEAQALAALKQVRGRAVRLVLGERPTDYQQALGDAVRAALRLRDDPAARALIQDRIIIGPPAFNAAAAAEGLCQEDVVRLKYEAGLAGLLRMKMDQGRTTLLLCGVSDFGDMRLAAWVREKLA